MMTFNDLVETLAYARNHYDAIAGDKDKLLYAIASSEEHNSVALIFSGTAKQLAGALAFHASKDEHVATAVLMAAEIVKARIAAKYKRQYDA